MTDSHLPPRATDPPEHEAFLHLPTQEILDKMLLPQFEVNWEKQRVLFIKELPFLVGLILSLLNPFLSLVKIAMDKILTLCFQQKFRFLWVNPLAVAHGSPVSQ